MNTLAETYRFSVEEYHKLGETGIFHEDDRVELIAGEIVEMSPVGGRHVEAVSRFTRLLSRQVGDGMLVNVQSPIRLANDGEPEPDLAVVRDRAYGGELPTAADVLLVIEVADTSLAYDRNVKLPLYAAAGIPESWLYDVGAAAIERHSEPRNGRYRLVALAGRGESLTSTVLPAVTLSVDDILG